MTGLSASRPSGTAGVVHVVTGLDAYSGGPSYSVPRLAAAEAELGADVALLSVAGAGEPRSETLRDGFRDIRARRDWAGLPVLGTLRLSSGLRAELDGFCAKRTVVHSHGLWRMPNLAAASAARTAGRPHVVSPRGMLAPAALAFSRARKAVFWKLLQGPALRGVACIHATSPAERDDIRSFGLTSPIAVVPNGVDLPDLSGPHPVVPGGVREALYIGRLHPKKALDVLIEAWANVASSSRQGWRLRIVGPGELGYGEHLSRMVASRGLSDVSIEDPVFGPEKFQIFRRAELFVMPTRNENFGLTVAEALASETPVICSRGAPWGGLETRRCGWWIPFGVEALTAALEAAMALPDRERRAMGARGREWMAADFSWRAVAERMFDIYAWLQDGGEVPESVQIAG